MELSQLQEKIVSAEDKVIFVNAAAASGKALINSTKLYTEEGTKTIGEIQVGDFIYCEDGLLHKVKGVYSQGKKKVYEVTFNDGKKIYCCGDHLWTFSESRLLTNLMTKTTKEIKDMELMRYSFSPHIKHEGRRYTTFLPNHSYFVGGYERVENPYLLGVLLKSSQPDKGIMGGLRTAYYQYLKEIIPESFEVQLGYFPIPNSLEKILEDNKLAGLSEYELYIPPAYMQACLSDRMALLNGLIDSDYFYRHSRYTIQNIKSKRLAEDIEFLCGTLGLESRIYFDSDGRGITIYPTKRFPYLHKYEDDRTYYYPPKEYFHISFHSIKELDREEEMTCIEVDNSTHLFLAEGFKVTHNTTVLTERINRAVKANKKVVAFTFTNMAAATIKKRLGLSNNSSLFIGTIHSYCAHLLFKNGIRDQLASIQNKNFDELFEIIKCHPECVEDIDLCLCDETQDSNELQLEFIFDILKAKQYFIVFDLRQSIYRFAGAEPELLIERAEQLNAKIYSLNENYRNGSAILSFAKKLSMSTGIVDDSISMSEEYGYIRKDTFSLGMIANLINESQAYGDWAVLLRTNKDVDTVYNYLKRNRIPCDTFKQGDLDKEELESRMAANTVKVLTIHSAKGLEWDYVIAYGMRAWNDEECCISYVAATRAKRALIWLKSPQKTKKPKIQSWEF